MGKWSDLTAQQKAAVIKFAMDNGVSDINSIRDTYNLYSASTWTSEMENNDYDMAAAKAAGIKADYRGHYPDIFKKPNHVTFSTESMYSDPIVKGGTWREDYTSFTPSDFQKRNWTREEMLEALKNQGDENVTLNYGEGGGIHIKHPGRLTDLKKRTGKTEAELWATGNAHTRKMIQFARNARKFKRDEGGELFGDGGKIYIKPSKRGTFTAAATKHGKSVQEFARQVLANKENYSPAMIRKAVFAHNVASWKHSTGGPLYPFSFNGYIPSVRYQDGGEFLANDNIKNVQVWLNKGTRFQKQRPGTVNLQNITDRLDPFGPDNQYIWDDAEHNSYSAFRRNPDYRAPMVPSIHIGPQAFAVQPVTVPKINISVPKPKVSYGFTKQIIPTGNWIQTDTAWNPAYGYEVFHKENSSPAEYGIKYYSVPGTINGGQGSFAVNDSTIMGISSDELSRRIFDYRTNYGGWDSFKDPNDTN